MFRKVCQVAARVFGVSLSDVHVSETATDRVANSSPSAASLSTDLYGARLACSSLSLIILICMLIFIAIKVYLYLYLYPSYPFEGMATLNACEEIRRRLEPVSRSLASQRAASGGAPPSFKEVAAAAYFQRIDLSAHGFYIVPADKSEKTNAHYFDLYIALNIPAHFCNNIFNRLLRAAVDVLRYNV